MEVYNQAKPSCIKVDKSLNINTNKIHILELPSQKRAPALYILNSLKRIQEFSKYFKSTVFYYIWLTKSIWLIRKAIGSPTARANTVTLTARTYVLNTTKSNKYVWPLPKMITLASGS